MYSALFHSYPPACFTFHSSCKCFVLYTLILTLAIVTYSKGSIATIFIFCLPFLIVARARFNVDVIRCLNLRKSPGRVAQSVTCLATDACLTADPGVASSIPVRSHTFVEIDHEMISTVILLPSADSFKKGCCQLQAKVCARITG